MGPVPFVIYINNTDVGVSYFISKFGDDTMIGKAALSEQDRQSLQENLRKLSDWGSGRCPLTYTSQILQIGSKIRKMNYEMCGVKIERSVGEDLGVTVSTNL